MAYPEKNRNVFCIPKEKKNPDEDLTGMFSDTKKIEPTDRDWSTDAMRTQMVSGKVKKVVPVDIEIELTENDIFNWLMDCKDPKTLRNLGRAALNFAKGLEDPDDDDFRSRA